MDASAGKDPSTARQTSRLLRYPLRSAIKSREEKPPAPDVSNPGSVIRRGKNESSVSKSMNVLDVSGKEKLLNKPPRRLSVTGKSIASPAQKSTGSVTPVSEARRTSAASLRKSATPYSAVLAGRGHGVITSASYWLSQIRLSESAAKHSISLGFFKLAFEAGCEPIQRMAEELKSYQRLHDLAGFEETTKSLFDMYGIISESIQPPQASVTVSESHPATYEEASTDADAVSDSSSSVPQEKPKLEPSSATVDEANQSENAQNMATHEDDSIRKSRRSAPKKSAAANSEKEPSAATKPQKKLPRQEGDHNKGNIKKQGKKSLGIKETVNSKPEGAVLENKENSENPSA